MPPRPVELEPRRPLGAASYYGDKGILMHGSHGAMTELVPADTNFAGPDLWLPPTANNYVDWPTLPYRCKSRTLFLYYQPLQVKTNK